jgi:hypothetical protein
MANYKAAGSLPLIATRRDEKGVYGGVGAISLKALVALVPNPADEENPRKMRDANRAARKHAELRAEVQRVLRGTAKGRNVSPYADYIVEGQLGKFGRGWSLPSVLLWMTQTPASVAQGEIELGELVEVELQFGSTAVAIDGETETAALHLIIDEPERYGLDSEEIGEWCVPVEMVWGVSASQARQMFHDRNQKGIQVAKTLALGMDSRDFGTMMAEEAANRIVLTDGTLFANRVNRNKRQLAKNDPHWVTLSAFRSLAVTTYKGRAGTGVLDVEEPDDDVDEIKEEVAQLIASVVQQYEAAFAERTAITAPAVLAGIGVLLYQATSWAGSERLSLADVLMRLDTVDWTRGSHWLGVAAKSTKSGGLSFAGGVKDAAGQVADALRDPYSENGRKIRKS